MHRRVIYTDKTTRCRDVVGVTVQSIIRIPKALPKRKSGSCHGAFCSMRVHDDRRRSLRRSTVGRVDATSPEAPPSVCRRHWLSSTWFGSLGQHQQAHRPVFDGVAEYKYTSSLLIAARRERRSINPSPRGVVLSRPVICPKNPTVACDGWTLRTVNKRLQCAGGNQ